MRKILTLLCVAVAAMALSGCTQEKSPKYVFYFIGDGMGLNMIHAAEMYKGAQMGLENKADKIDFAQFPSVGIVTTSSFNSYITDSAAAGTALSTGEKTTNGTIAMDADHTDELRSVSDDIKQRGMGVAILSTVSIDHATPAAFFAHSESRKNTEDIAMDGTTSTIDILGGSGFLDEIAKGDEIFDAYSAGGFTRIKGKAELSKVDQSNQKYVITERDGVTDVSLALAVDRTQEDLTLSDLVSTSVDYLYEKYKDEGFMIMAESGMIDWVSHANDATSMIHEVIDLDAAVAVAYEFYKQHPDETLIIVTADHETGGYGNGTYGRGYQMNFSRMLCQIPSKGAYASDLELTADFEDLKLPGEFKFTEEELEELEEAYEEIIEERDIEKRLERGHKIDPGDYHSAASEFAQQAYRVINKAIGAGWTTTDHTASPVMSFSIGAGSENFTGRIDNTQIPSMISTVVAQ